MNSRILFRRRRFLSVLAVIIGLGGLARAEDRTSDNLATLTRVESGVAEPVEEVIRAERAGTVVALLVKPGDVVTKGQMLGHTEVDSAKWNLDTAQANLDATGTLDQMFWQHQAWGVTREEMEDAVRKRTVPKSRLQYVLNMEKVAKSQLEAQQDLKKVQKINLEHFRTEYKSRFFHSPIDGVVTEVRVELGQAVSLAAHAFTVSNSTHLTVPVEVPAATATAALQAGKLSVRPKRGKTTIWAKVTGVTEEPGTPEGKKILHLWVNKADIPLGAAPNELKFDVLVPQGKNSRDEAA